MTEKVEVVVSSNSEVDTLDAPAASKPIHLSEFSPVSSRNGKNSSSKAATPKKPRLTLSAFRRPEQTVRLTESDPTRCLENEYDLRGPGCGVLGHGAFSTVRLGIRRSDRVKVAVKSIAKHEALRARRLRRGGRRHLDEWDILR